MNDEARERNEEAMIQRIEKTMRDKLAKDYAPGATRRDAHPRHLGLLEASFAVAPSLPPELAVGLFAEARTYKAWVRSSSASGRPQSDAVKDLRGLAIKLLDVPGDKFAGSDEPGTQDFVLLSAPALPLGTVKLFHDAIYYSMRYSPLVFAAKMILTGKAHVLRELNALRAHQTSPLEIRYWSNTPYRFGPDRAVKWGLLPTSGTPSVLPDPLGETYLSDAMERRLDREAITFDFAVQFQKEGMPIDDIAVRWDESRSPFLKLGTLTIPAQRFRTPERDQLAEALSFSPAHARAEHRPLGSINRARAQVYRANSDFRHQRRGLPRLNQ